MPKTCVILQIAISIPSSFDVSIWSIEAQIAGHQQGRKFAKNRVAEAFLWLSRKNTL
jgi:hypothetical protein